VILAIDGRCNAWVRLCHRLVQPTLDPSPVESRDRSGGLDAKAGLTDCHLEEVGTCRVVLERAARSDVTAEWSKFDMGPQHRLRALSAFTGVISERAAIGEFAAALDTAGNGLIVAGWPGAPSQSPGRGRASGWQVCQGGQSDSAPGEPFL
jgi:hypothetical protein